MSKLLKKSELTPFFIARIIYAKEGDFVLLGHLDMMSLIDKALRRTELEFITGRGYKRKLKFSSSPALSLGFSSGCEFIDAKLAKDYPADFVKSEISRQFPEGLNVRDVLLSEAKFPVPCGCVYEKKYFKFFKKKTRVIFGEKQKVTPPARRISFIYPV